MTDSREMTARLATPEASALPPTRGLWWRAAIMAAGAVYGPHLLMGLFALGAVSCEHCRVTVWKFLIIAPGVELAMLFRHHLLMYTNVVSLPIASGLSLLLLAGVAGLLWRCRRWRWLVFILSALPFTAGAFLLLAMIRA